MSDVSSYLRIRAAAEQHSSEARWPAAAALWSQVVEQNPVNGGHWAGLAEARYELGDYRGALAGYEKAEENGVWAGGDDIDTVFPAEIAYRMACCHLRLGDHDSAVRELGRARGWASATLTGLARTSTGNHCGLTGSCARCSGLSTPR
jgi:tetratricopeptide (TPR) repeat protein